MKNYRNAIAVLTLTLALSTAAYADGIMSTDKATPTPTPAVNGIMSTDAADRPTSTDESASAPEISDAVTAVALNLLQSVLTLF